MWWEELLRAVCGAFFGTVGFAMLVHIPKRAWLVSGLVAVFSYLLYWGLLRLGLSDPASIFLGALFGSLTAQLCARKMKIISTVFLISAIVPVVPGLGLYRMMSYLGQGQLAEGGDQGIRAMMTIGMIALGLGAGAFLDRLFHMHAHKNHHV